MKYNYLTTYRTNDQVPTLIPNIIMWYRTYYYSIFGPLGQPVMVCYFCVAT